MPAANLKEIGQRANSWWNVQWAVGAHCAPPALSACFPDTLFASLCDIRFPLRWAPAGISQACAGFGWVRQGEALAENRGWGSPTRRFESYSLNQCFLSQPQSLADSPEAALTGCWWCFLPLFLLWEAGELPAVPTLLVHYHPLFILYPFLLGGSFIKVFSLESMVWHYVLLPGHWLSLLLVTKDIS